MVVVFNVINGYNCQIFDVALLPWYLMNLLIIICMVFDMAYMNIVSVIFDICIFEHHCCGI